MNNYTILIVFPKRSESVSIKKMLHEKGIKRVDIGTNGVGAWSLLNQNKYDLVIADRHLPGDISGMELVKRINSDRVLFIIPLIMVTSENRKNKIMEAIYAGVSGYVLKPYALGTIEKKVEEVLNARGAFSKSMNKVEQGKELLQSGDLDAAIATFENVVVEGPQAESLYNSGYQAMAQGRYDDAILAFRRAIEANHLYAEAYRGLGEAYMKKGDIEQAEKFLIKAGQLFIQRTEFDEAREAILMALQVNPNSVNPYNTLGIVYRKTGDFKKSVQYYELAMQINPHDEKIYYNMAHSLLSQGLDKAALDTIEKALEIKPDFTEAMEFKQHIVSRKKQPPSSEIQLLRDRYEPRKESIDEIRSIIRATDKKTGREVRIIRYEPSENMMKTIERDKMEKAWETVTQTGRLTHPYAALVYEISRDNNSFFFIEEWIEGETLAEMIEQEKAMPLRMALEIAMVIANVLGFMHKEGILHQALTPADVVMTKDRMIKVRGFSLFAFEKVLRTGCDSAPAAVNPYLSPEHFSDKPLTPASDVFTLGSILYEMMMRERPFAAESISNLVYKVCFEDPKPFRHPDERLASAVQAIFQQALAKDPSERYATGIDMEGALIDALDVLDRNWRNAHQFLKRV